VTDARDLPRLPHDRGVTLVELMVVLVLLAVGLLALAGVQTRSSRDVDATGRDTRALSAAENHMEIARAAGYLGAVADSGQTGVFTWNTQVDSVGIGLRRISVRVTWSEKGRARSVQLDNLVAAR
jgi:prepilin-type N-terminal cleavage/methylation domain-containing protein